MQDRLAELHRQRALVANHLAWLDRELAAIVGAQPIAPAKAPELVREPSTIAAPVPPPDPTAVPLPEHSPAIIKQDVRRGCFLYFALALLLVVGGGAFLVWASQAYKAKHPPAPRVEAPESR